MRQTSVHIKSVNTNAEVVFSDLDGEFVSVAVRGPGRSATKEVSLYTDPLGIANLLQSAANDWSGWDGTKTWSSLERDFKIELSCKRSGHVNLTVTLDSEMGGADPWFVRSTIGLEAGQLSHIAKLAARFFRATPDNGPSAASR